MNRNRFIQAMNSNIGLSEKERRRIIRNSIKNQPWKLKCTVAYICLEFLKSIFDISPEELQKAMDVKLQREREK